MSALTACATPAPPSCAGLAPVDQNVAVAAGSVLPDALPGDDAVQRLRCNADRGVASAATELGRRYETGDGVPVDPARAASLYKRAATPVPSYTHIYAPPVRLGGQGQVLILPNAGGSAGDPEAQYRLGVLYLEGRGVARSPERARKLIARAAAQGYPVPDDIRRAL